MPVLTGACILPYYHPISNKGFYVFSQNLANPTEINDAYLLSNEEVRRHTDAAGGRPHRHGPLLRLTRSIRPSPLGPDASRTVLANRSDSRTGITLPARSRPSDLLTPTTPSTAGSHNNTTTCASLFVIGMSLTPAYVSRRRKLLVCAGPVFRWAAPLGIRRQPSPVLPTLDISIRAAHKCHHVALNSLPSLPRTLGYCQRIV